MIKYLSRPKSIIFSGAQSLLTISDGCISIDWNRPERCQFISGHFLADLRKIVNLTSTSFVTLWFHLWKLNMDLGFSNPPLHFLRPWHEVPRHTIRIVLLLYFPTNLYIAGLGFLRQWFFDASICRILQINPKTQVREIILNQIKKHTVVASEYYHAGLIMHFNLFNSNCILQNSHRWLIWWGSHFVTTGIAI